MIRKEERRKKNYINIIDRLRLFYVSQSHHINELLQKLNKQTRKKLKNKLGVSFQIVFFFISSLIDLNLMHLHAL